MTVVKVLSIMLDYFCTSFLSDYYALLTKVLQTCGIPFINMYSQSLSGATCACMYTVFKNCDLGCVD